MRTFLSVAAAMLTFACCTPAVLFGDESVIDVNPSGRPKSIAKGQAVRYFLWHDSDGWHLQSDSGGRKHAFSGTVEVIGGKVTKISDFDNLEPERKKKNRDLGFLNEAKNEIKFKFATSKARDGFDFQVDESATQIRFRLLIDGKALPQRVLIGAESQPAPDEEFTLPAHPE